MELTKYIVKGDEVWERYSDDLFRGYARMNPPVAKGSPWLCYVGPKISLVEWRKILAFFKWSYDDFKGEAQVRLYFHKEQGIWRAWAFPQEKDTGMTTKELPEKEGEERQKADLGRGWILGGTVHHHCTGAAFQSGTDRDNETSQNGAHITVGKMDKHEYDLHGRVVFRGTFYDLDWSEWFEMPPGLEGLPAAFYVKVMEHFLTRGVTNEDTFPSEWKDNVIKKTYAPYYPPGRKWETSQTPSESSGRHLEFQGPEKDDEKGHESDTDNTAGGSKTRYFPSMQQSDNGKAPKPLTKKEKRLFRKLLNRAGPGDIPESELNKLIGDSEENSAKLHRAALATVQLCASYGMEVSEVFTCLMREPHHLDPLQLNAVEDLHLIMEKEGVFPAELQDWITDVTLSIEDEKKEVGGEIPRT